MTAKTFNRGAKNDLTGICVSGTVVSIVYDAFGNRVSKTVNGVMTKYLVEDDANPTGYPQVFDESAGGVVTRTYTYRPQRIGQDQIVDGARTPTGYGYNGGGNVRQLTNLAVTVTDPYEFDASSNDIRVPSSDPVRCPI
jgi:hypothetical protein